MIPVRNPWENTHARDGKQAMGRHRGHTSSPPRMGRQLGLCLGAALGSAEIEPGIDAAVN